MARAIAEKDVVSKCLDYGFNLVGDFKGNDFISNWECVECGYIFERKWRVMNSNGSRTCRSCLNIERDKEKYDKLVSACSKLDCELLEDMSYEARDEMVFKRDAYLNVKFSCGHTEERLCETIHTRMKSKCLKCAGVSKWSPEKITKYLLKKGVTASKDSIYRVEANGHWRIGDFTYVCGHTGKNVHFNSIRNTSGLCSECSHSLNTNRLSPIEMFEKTKELEGVFGKGNVFLYYNSDISDVKYRKSRALCGHIKCLECSRWFDARVTQLYGDSPRVRCERCSKRESSGENKIRTILEAWGIDYESQYKFDELLSAKGSLLKFDFAVKSGESLKLLIEFDGQQHYESIEAWGGDIKFSEIVDNDNKKNVYCENNSIPLLRIPYWEQGDIERIVFSELVSCKILEEDI